MKKMKKILAMLLALTMVLGMGLTSMAATKGSDGVFGTRDDRGTIKVYGIEEANLEDVMAYPIVVADYDESTNVFLGYKMFSDEYSIEDIENPTKDELDAIKEIATEGVATEGVAMQYNSSDNFYYLDNLSVGMYLIVIPPTETTTYNVAVASIYYTNNVGNENDVVEGPTSIKAIVDEPVWAKKDKALGIEKTVDGEAGVSANVGDDLTYVLAIDEMPSYTGSNPVLYVTDEMATGLTYNGDLAVYVDKKEDGSYKHTLNEGTNYTISVDDGVITVNFVIETEIDGNKVYTYNNNEYAGSPVYIEYTAKLNDEAVRNDSTNEKSGNENTATVFYTKDSHEVVSVTDDDDTAVVYTFDLTQKLVKVDQDGVALPGATFEVYKKDESGNKVTWGTTLEGVVDGDTPAIGVYVTDEDGILYIQGLEAGTYYLKEIEAPSGYSLNEHEFEIVVDETIDNKTGELTAWLVTIDGEDIGDALEIRNTQLNALPSTGGIGTTIFTVAGCGIMIAAAFFFFASRKKEN